jgi:hypothetical protein
LVQTALIVIWVVLHRRRLRDAGKPVGIVIGLALVYALEVVLLTMLLGMMLASTSATSVGPDAPILSLFVVLYFLSLLAGDPSFGALQLWIAIFVVVMLLPVALALGLSLWAATRPSVPASS